MTAGACCLLQSQQLDDVTICNAAFYYFLISIFFTSTNLTGSSSHLGVRWSVTGMFSRSFKPEPHTRELIMSKMRKIIHVAAADLLVVKYVCALIQYQ